jgi:hypothetical protein
VRFFHFRSSIYESGFLDHFTTPEPEEMSLSSYQKRQDAELPCDGESEGPFPAETMLDWNARHFFHKNTSVRLGSWEHFQRHYTSSRISGSFSMLLGGRRAWKPSRISGSQRELHKLSFSNLKNRHNLSRGH